MKPLLGWTMLSRDAVRQVERSLANSEQDTRDEIGNVFAGFQKYLYATEVCCVMRKAASGAQNRASLQARAADSLQNVG